MPYIETPRRKELLPYIGSLSQALYELGFQKGDLNYVVTKLLINYTKHHGKCYDTMSNGLAVLKDIDHEFRRKVLDKYEDKKADENGEVFTI